MQSVGIIFDLDGTLVNTNAAHVDSWIRALAAFGFSVPPDRIWPEVGKGGDKIVPDLLGEEVEKKQGDRIREHVDAVFLEMAAREHFVIFPGTKELLLYLRKRNIRTAIATSSAENKVQAIEKSCGMQFSDYCDAVVTAQKQMDSKPDPDLLAVALDRLHRTAAESVMVGDTQWDGKAAKKIGMTFWGVTCGGFNETVLRAAGAEKVYMDPADILKALQT